MVRKDNKTTKLLILLISMLIVALIVILYFLDRSLGWGTEKIVSCIFVNLWCFFMIPALRQSYLINEDKDLVEWFKMGYRVGASGIWMPVLLSPFYGVIYYFKQKY
jgi:uncharacterized membrane protein YwaF